MQEVKYVTGLLVSAGITFGLAGLAVALAWPLGTFWSLVAGISVGLVCYRFIWLPCLRRPMREQNSILEERAPDWWNPHFK